MRFAKLTLIAAALAATSAAAVQSPRQRAQAEVAAQLAALPATGKPRECLNLRDVQQSKPVGDRIIMFRTGANRWYRSDLPISCSADDTTAFVYRSSIGQLCSIDVVDVFDPVSRIPRGFCKLGKFTPVQVPKGTKF